MLREISQIQEDKYYLITESNKVETVDMEGERSIARGIQGAKAEVGLLLVKACKVSVAKE